MRTKGAGGINIRVDPVTVLRKVEKLEHMLRSLGDIVVAFSGGADSAYLLFKALAVKGRDHVLAVTVDSPLSPPGEVEAALALAKELQARHQVIFIDQLADRGFSANSPERCYLCKKIIMTKMLAIANAEGHSAVIEGSNADDLNDYRPGMRALQELGVCSPMVEAALQKAEIRCLSKQSGLSTWDKPAAPCLVTRFGFEEELRLDLIKQVGEGERYLRSLGVKGNLRLRIHGSLARIEVSAGDADLIMAQREHINARLREIGFQYVTLDLCGFRSG
jgi:pyridinium-3,5-biscarboxylic acid mononucleotide sulfurtransferase